MWLLKFLSYWLCARDDGAGFQMQQESSKSVAVAPRTRSPKLLFTTTGADFQSIFLESDPLHSIVLLIHPSHTSPAHGAAMSQWLSVIPLTRPKKSVRRQVCEVYTAQLEFDGAIPCILQCVRR